MWEQQLLSAYIRIMPNKRPVPAGSSRFEFETEPMSVQILDEAIWQPWWNGKQLEQFPPNQ